jgi:preprotein translocase subunit SecG
MSFLIGILTFIMVVVCLILILLVLIQLPKKEAGAGVAFGGAATDALFGAGSGNVLTKTTKYMSGAFFVLAIALTFLQNIHYHKGDTQFKKDLKAQQSQPLSTPSAPEDSTPIVVPTDLLAPPAEAVTNAAPAAPPTNLSGTPPVEAATNAAPAE